MRPKACRAEAGIPELPEVETVKRQLAEAVTHLRFAVVEAIEPAMLRDTTEEQLRTELPGRTIVHVGRLGKFLLLKMDGQRHLHLTLHLGMTGQILVTPYGKVQAGADGPHTRFVFKLVKDDGTFARFEFRDIRKFGRVHLTGNGPAPKLRDLGPDAWIGDWDTRYLKHRLRGRRAPIKAFLLDQRNLAGIGNIYADEILWWAELAPLRPCGTLTVEEVARLAAEIRLTLEEGVRRLGCTVADFVDIEGRPGGFQERLRAYGRQGQDCVRCGEKIIRVIIAGRGTGYCPGCQR
ncbi:MAG TPA: bifunctional DNA-formamidopyrimidine glycosylase/DNA-(apurinic or apyrimidinic site) lyase [Thermoleophilia bacterium]|nr:bifunctional DNA-formamidopyrimidine glycosylase/DNA-(apurinic or apyrimidinic site) lyase [Thermoleophilia bacterium]